MHSDDKGTRPLEQVEQWDLDFLLDPLSSKSAPQQARRPIGSAPVQEIPLAVQN